MKNLSLIATLLVSSISFAEIDGTPFDRAFQQMRFSNMSGKTPDGEMTCLVENSFEPEREGQNEKGDVTYKLFGMKTIIRFSDGKAVNYVSDFRIAGGRGDCPEVLADGTTEFKIRNRVCDASPRGRPGAAGFIDLERGVRHYSIWGKDDKLAGECIVGR